SVQRITFCVSNTLFFNRIGSEQSFASLGMNGHFADKAAIQPQRLIRQDRAQTCRWRIGCERLLCPLSH
ncbi:hypothetical protein, partial [Ruegeria sp. HKCCA4812]|uniref:hypothetical protein n=1 Tax=Ruegeria sp. HKCCA4812 TaxID=2682993 RepID=UPI001C2BD09E